MKTTFLVASALVVALSGCAGHALNKWASENKPLAEQGQMKWSDYYAQLYKQAEESRISNKASVLERANIMILVSKEFESGRMSKDQFDYFTRLAQIAEEREDEASSASSRQAWAAALQGIGDSYKATANTFQQRANTYQQPIYQAPVETKCQTFGNRTSCTSQ